MIPSLLSRLVPERAARLLLSSIVTVALLVATYHLARIFDAHHPLENWLAWRYFRAWGTSAFFCLACLSSGNLIVSALSRPGERQDGHVILSFAVGVVVFASGMFLIGVAGWLTKAAFVVLPSVLFAVGAPRLYRDLLRYRFWAPDRPPIVFSPVEACVLGAGAIALAALYVPILSPDNASFDARWYHMGLADHYVAGGAIERLPEGAMIASIPQLASLLYAWSFLQPGAELFDRVILCAHLEFVIFLFTLPGIPLLVRLLVPGVRARSAWVALFLFPSIFVYDHSLLIGADHIAALWTIPVYVVTIRALRELDVRTGVLLAFLISGLLLAKYTAAPAAILPALALPLRAAWLATERLRKRRFDLRWVAGLAALLATGLVLTAQHWLKNWIWYGDPLYPLLHRHLSVRPWSPQSEFYLDVFHAIAWEADGTASEKLDGAIKAMRDYHYELYGWEVFHKRNPVVGSLFSLGLVALPFLYKAGRLWALTLVVHLGIAIWFLYFHDTRYLRPLIPLMTAGIVALGLGCFRLGWGPRAGVVALAGLQAIWGLGMIFWPVHAMTGKSGLGTAAEFFARGFTSPALDRSATYSDYAAVGRVLTKKAVLLLHHEHMHAGMGVRTVTDYLPAQITLDYGTLGSPRGVHKKLKELGVTHAAWVDGAAYADNSLASELLFHTYVERFTEHKTKVGGRTVAELPRRAPADFGDGVVYFGCDSTYASGLYEIGDLGVSPLQAPNRTKKYPRPRMPWVEPPTSLIEMASYAVVMRACPNAPSLEHFETLAKYGTTEFMVRKQAPDE